MKTNIVTLINNMGKIDMTRPISRSESGRVDDRYSRPFAGRPYVAKIYEGLTFAAPYRDSEGVPERGIGECRLYAPADVEVEL